MPFSLWAVGLRCFSVTLWFYYFQLETGCDSDCKVDCVIEWTNHIHTCAHRHIHIYTCTHILCQCTHTHSYVALYTHTLRVSGNVAGFPQFAEAPEGEQGWADDGAAPAVDIRTLLGFNIGLKHQMLTWLTLRSEKRIKHTHTRTRTTACVLWKQKNGWKWGKTLRSASETHNICQCLPHKKNYIMQTGFILEKQIAIT